MISYTVNMPFRIVAIRNLLIFCLTLILPVTSNAASGIYSTKDFNRWLNAAYIAEAAYSDSHRSDNNLNLLLDKHGYELTDSQQIAGYAVNYFILTNDDTKHQIIAIRGTANAENVLVDATFVLVHDDITDIDIHQGFLISARDIFQQIKPRLKPGYQISTIGHSLGGATALVLAMMLDVQNYPVDKVITFGQPKVTNISGSRKFQHLNLIRLVTVKDMVPLVPPVDPLDMMKLSIFWHLGTEVILYEDNRYSVLTGVDSMLRATDFLNDIPGEQHLNNHFMTTYVAYLKAKLKSPEQIKFKNDFKFTDWFGSSKKTSPETNP